jgi:tRNA(adenine34) deaminase
MLKRTTTVSDEDMMRRCFALAEQSAKQGEYPYAAVIVRNGIVVAETTNKVAQDRDVTHHAELVAICQAQETLASTDLSDCTIYANMEPCVFCSYAIRESRIARVVFSLRSPVMGGTARWNILGDRVLSDTMPEVFAPPPVIVPEFLCEEAAVALERSAPLAWSFMRSRGLVATSSPQDAGLDPTNAGAVQRAYGFGDIAEWIMRILRKNFFDRFGRGGGKRRKHRSRAGEDVKPFP